MSILKTKNFLILGLGFVLSILMFMVINLKSSKKNFLKEKGFTRNIKDSYVDLIKQNQLGSDHYTLLGIIDDRVYLRSYNNPSIISIPSSNKSVTSSEYNDIKTYDLEKDHQYSIEVDEINKNINIFNSITQVLTIINADNFTETHRITLKDRFTRASKLGSTILTTTDSSYKLLLKMYKIDNNHKVTFVKSFNMLNGTSMNEDGIIINNNSNCFAYVPFYKNSFYIIDTLSNIIHGKTIDTISTGPKTDLIMNKTKMVYSEPVRITNSNFHFFNNFLAVESAVASDTPYENIKHNSLIDLYNIRGNYKYSIKVNAEDKIKPNDFYIKDSLMYLLSNNSIFIYKIHIQE